MDKSLSMFLGGGLVVAIVIVVFLLGRNPQTLGSVSATNEYQATSTAPNAVYGALTADALIRTGRGSLGSVVVTGAAAGVLNFYDATSTNVQNGRAAAMSTSTILIASLPASIAAGTYVFDAEFTNGLYIELEHSGTMPTTTVTWRPN